MVSQSNIDLDSWEKTQKPKDFGSRFLKLSRRLGFDTRVTHLVTGDIRFLTVDLELILIERKSTAGDLFNSSTQRLQQQCLRMIDEADIPILLIDGPLQINYKGRFRAGRFDTGWEYSQVMHIILELQQRGLIVMYCPKSSFTPQAVINLYKFFQKSEHTALLQSRLKPFPTNVKGLSSREKKIRTLMSLDGVGLETANRLIDIYGSVTAVGQAPIDGLTSIPRLSKETALKIKETLT